MKRFDLVVFNYRRLDSWLRNSNRLRGFDPALDRITIVSASPSEEETALVRKFESNSGFRVRYLTRENRGIDQLARIEYFTGTVGTLDENLAYDFIFQMQDHYLDTEASFSHWGPELNFRIKGDVVPDGIVFDLSALYEKLIANDLSGAFCDRNNPCWFALGTRRYITPNGGNFIVRTANVRDARTQRMCLSLRSVCDDTYLWAVYAEFMWGVVFFEEGLKFYDIKRDRVFSTWERDLFYVSPDDVAGLYARYGPISEEIACDSRSRFQLALERRLRPWLTVLRRASTRIARTSGRR